MILPSENFEFPWPILKVVLEGHSILDIPRLELKSMEEATALIQAYGFDVTDSAELEILWRYFDDAVRFIERALADPRYPRVPDHMRSREKVSDLRRLLLLASSATTEPDQIWACGILRLMHVLIHLTHDPRLRYFDQVQNQVLGRLDVHIHVDSRDGATYLGDQAQRGGIKLLFFKKKDRKDREREIIKLLHKSDSVAEDIYDRIGFRLVTETKFDAARAVRLMVERNIISIPNLRPGRSRNRLIDLDKLKTESERLRDHIASHLKEAGDGNENWTQVRPFARWLRRMERRIGLRRGGSDRSNPHTSEHFHSIQFTCRELVKVRQPQYQIYARLKEELQKFPGGDQILAEAFQQPPPHMEYVFFPYEIQIMDVKSYADSIFGRSNHEDYRRKQLDSARHRVFGPPPPPTD